MSHPPGKKCKKIQKTATKAAGFISGNGAKNGATAIIRPDLTIA